MICTLTRFIKCDYEHRPIFYGKMEQGRCCLGYKCEYSELAHLQLSLSLRGQMAVKDDHL